MYRNIVKILCIFLLIPICSYAENTKYIFNWDKYFENLENIQSKQIDNEKFINFLGEKYFSVAGVNYFDDDNKKLEILGLALDDEQESIKLFAIDLLKSQRIDQYNAKLLTMLKNEKTAIVKRHIIWAIGYLGDSSFVLPLTQLLKMESDENIKLSLSLALGRLGGTGDEIDPILYLAENSKNFYVKCAAILGIGRLKLKEGKDILLKHIESQSKEIRFSAVLSLSFIEDNDDDKELLHKISQMFYKDESVYVKIVCSFYILKNKGYKNTYANFLTKWLGHPYYQFPALDFIECLAYPEFIMPLKTALSEHKSILLKQRINLVLNTFQIKMKNGGYN